ncbi:MAG: CHAD domain-containing protein, partial [Thiotrichales bacterium]|nr:CHAD domain-containing protein [Thiotrichales bacterium]
MNKLDPEQRTDHFAKAVFLDLLHEMIQHENALLEKHSEKTLHQFRIAVRKTRSLLGQSKQVLPENRLSRFRREFSWLGDFTSGPRDLDVYLIRIKKLKSERSFNPQHIVPFTDYLRERRDREHQHLYDSLFSKRYRRL